VELVSAATKLMSAVLDWTSMTCFPAAPHSPKYVVVVVGDDDTFR